MPKQRLYKCRLCGHESDKKTDNWQHIRVHFQPDKLLACDSCQFVTQHKHHLEYHQRNHTGYKPFKCDSCDYQCVNRAMLNSHLKSHSSVFQYHCADCAYATKYVHSLKTHLRKYNHQASSSALTVDIGASPADMEHKRPSSTKSLPATSPVSSDSSTQDQCPVLDLRVDWNKRKRESFL